MGFVVAHVEQRVRVGASPCTDCDEVQQGVLCRVDLVFALARVIGGVEKRMRRSLLGGSVTQVMKERIHPGVGDDVGVGIEVVDRVEEGMWAETRSAPDRHEIEKGSGNPRTLPGIVHHVEERMRRVPVLRQCTTGLMSEP